MINKIESASGKNAFFEAIQKSLNPQNSHKKAENELKFKVGETYHVRLLPNLEAPEDTFFAYKYHFWYSLTNKKPIYVLSPATYGERCPITEVRMEFYNNREKNAEYNEIAKKCINRRDSWKVNVYVIKDTNNPDNEGKVMIMKYSKELNDVIQKALNRPDMGVGRVFSLDENGCNLEIDPIIKSGTGNAKIPTYATSVFSLPHAIEGMNEEKIKEVLGSLHDLKATEELKSEEEIEKIVKEHFLDGIEGLRGGEKEETVVGSAPIKKSTTTPKTKNYLQNFAEGLKSSTQQTPKNDDIIDDAEPDDDDDDDDISYETESSDQESVVSPEKKAKLNMLLQGLEDL